MGKLQSKKFTDSHFGAKESDIIVGDNIVTTITQSTKTDPIFSSERYTVLAREGAKVLIINGNGTKLTRNIKEVKRVPSLSVRHSSDENEQDRSEEIEQTTPFETENSNRPKRVIQKPQRYREATLYQII